MKRCVKCKKEFEDFLEPCPADGGRHSIDPLIGVTIEGKYKLEKCIGRGGMGAVYIASHTKFNKQVAIKVLSHDFIETHPNALGRFQREAEAAALIKHPNAVTVSDFGQTSDGIIYLVMEYIDGMSLRHLLRSEGRLSPERAVNIGRQICAAISAAHRAGIVHRDLKPDNVMIEMIDNREMARVLDFGIAKLKDTQQLGKITDTGSLLGTPHYMSPEQCNGEPVDHRADIYAIGVMLYEMLAGEVPLEADVPMAIIVAHVTKEPKPLNQLCPSVPVALSQVVMCTLEKKPAHRPQSASDLSDQLEAALKAAETDQWRVILQGLAENTDECRRRVIDGLQRNFGLPATKAEEIIDNAPVIVKKAVPQDEATKVAERLKAIGALVKLESVLNEAASTVPLRSSMRSDTTVAANPKRGNTTADKSDRKKTEEVAQDPLLVTDSFVMSSYVNQKAKLSTIIQQPEEEQSQTVAFTKSIASPLPVASPVLTPVSTPAPNTAPIQSTSEDLAGPPTVVQKTVAQNNSSNTQQITGQLANNWTIEINGMFHENMADDAVEAWIRAGRIRKTHKARKGSGQWYDIGNIPQFRRIYDEIAPPSFGPTGTHSGPLPQIEMVPVSTKKLRRIASLGAALFVFYILISLGLHYTQRKLLQQDLHVILYDSRTTIVSLREHVRAALKRRDLVVPDEDIKISVNYPVKTVEVRVNYARTLLFLSLNYQAQEEKRNFNLPLELLAKVPDGQLELIGISQDKIAKARQELAAREAAAQAGEVLPPEQREVKPGDDLIRTLRQCENGPCSPEDIIIKATKAASGNR
ncbi:MAG: ribosomal protein L7/L12 [Acidobacteriota bacterium]